MTIFSTHKTDYETKLSKNEVVERLKNNDFYVPSFKYQLQEEDDSYTLYPLCESKWVKNSFIPVLSVSVSENNNETTKVSTKYEPLKSSVVVFIAILGFALLMQIVTAVVGAITGGLGLVHFVPAALMCFGYLLFMAAFSLQVNHIRIQLEETIEAEIHEITEEEMSKLQRWYEKKR